MSFCPLDWDILISSFKNIKLSFSNYPSLLALEMHKYDDIENALKIKDWKMPQEKMKMIISPKPKCRNYLKPCCKFGLVYFLETYQRKLINMDHGGSADDPFSTKVPKISLTGPIYGSIWVSMKAKRNHFEIFWKVIIKMSLSCGEDATFQIL